MPIKHVTKQIEPYLDQRLSPEERRRFEEHVAGCPLCTHHLFEARRLDDETGPMLKRVLGRPVPPGKLRYQIRQALVSDQKPRRFVITWAASGRFLNTIGTMAIVAALMYGAFIVIQGQAADTDVQRASSGTLEREVAALATPVSTPITRFNPAVAPTRNLDSFHETVPIQVTSQLNERPPTPTPRLTPDPLAAVPLAGQPQEEAETPKTSRPQPPDGIIAFSAFNTYSQVYETYLIDSNGDNLRRYGLKGISEPALRQAEDGSYQIAYRAWGEPTTPRSIMSNTPSGAQPTVLTHYLEDGQPDWSPKENRIIFASTREGDRRWRLYTVWGDGSVETNLRREGKSPSFAPDGYRFTFEGCEDTINQKNCGLWTANLDNSEHGAALVLDEPLAQAPDWSPVGEQIAYMANLNDNWDLYVINSDGSAPRQLTTDPSIDGLPTWSPDGEWLAFLSNRHNSWGIWLLHVETQQVHRLHTFSEGEFAPPDYPPYGQRQWWDEQISWVN